MGKSTVPPPKPVPNIPDLFLKRPVGYGIIPSDINSGPRTPTPSGHGGNPVSPFGPNEGPGSNSSSYGYIPKADPTIPGTGVTNPFFIPRGYGADPSNPTQPPVNGGGGGNSGNSGPAGPSALDTLYANLKASLGQTGVDNNALVDGSINRIKKNYSDATLDTYRTYMNSRDELSGRASNLGVDLDTSKMGQTWDGSMRRLNEMSDSNMNSDVSYMEKMRQIKQAALDSILNGLEQDKLSRLAAARSGGGGSYRGGGSGGSSSSSGRASETQTVGNVGDVEGYQQLLATNPRAAQAYYDHYWGNGADPLKAIASMLNAKSATPKKTGWTSVFNNLGNKVALGQAAQVMQGISGTGWGPNITKKVSYNGK